MRRTPATPLAALLLAAFAPAASPAQMPIARPGIDVLDYRLAVDLPDSGAMVAARATLTVRRRAPVDTLRLDLIGMEVDSVRVGGRVVSADRDSTTMAVPLPRGTGDTLEVLVGYHGAPRDGLIIRGEGDAWTAFGDDFPRRARYWIPSVDDPADKATVTWEITAPATRTVVANGELQEHLSLSATHGAPRAYWRWRESRPIATYLMVLAAARLVRVDLDTTSAVRQAVFALPEDAGFLPGPFARAPEIVAFFSRLIAPFPYEHLYHLESSTRFGGMENATAIFYADRSFRTRTLRVGTIAHETMHQWFGDAVTESRFAELWLSEGFATYGEQLWVQHADGDSAFRAGMRALRDEITSSRTSAMRPVIDTTEADYLALLNTNSYQKGAWVLHMLRARMGDSAFFRGLRAYYAAHRNGNARTADLERAMEDASGERLDWFFEQWLRRPGWAEITTHWRYDPRARRVTLYVEQGPRFAPARFPLTVELIDADGKTRRATVDVAPMLRQRIVIPLALDEPPRSLILDPDVVLLGTFR